MQCSTCRSRAPDDARFCAQCGTPLSAGSPRQQAERRQVTAFFCDIIGSTAIAARIEAEDLRDLLLEYRALCGDVVERHHGTIERFIGDGVLAKFGLPQASEDAASLAVRAGLEIAAGMPAFSRRIEARHGVAVRVRIGINTGTVVFDAADHSNDHGGLTGSPLHVAARLQELAPPDGVVIGPDTCQLVTGQFTFEALGERVLRGVDAPVRAFLVVGTTSARTQFEARAAAGLSPLVGRSRELVALTAAWERAAGGTLQTVVLVGEPGIGKSRLIHELQQIVTSPRVTRLGFTCSYHYRNTAFHPVMVELGRLFGVAAEGDRASRIAAALARLGIDNPNGALALATIFDTEPAASDRPEATTARGEIVPLLCDLASAMARRMPLLLVVEDLHWADPSTIDFIARLCGSRPDVPIMLVASLRTEHADLAACFDRRIDLPRMSAADCATLIAANGRDATVDPGIVHALIARSDGVPLFIEELTRSVADGYDAAGPGGGDAAVSVPASLQDSLMARLDRLGDAKETAQVAAIIGRTFSLDLLSAVSRRSSEAIAADVAKLLGAQLIYRAAAADDTGAAYEFGHDLIRESAQNSIVREVRRRINRTIADTITDRYPAHAARHPEVVAHHYAAAHCHDRALPLWSLAAARALRASACAEAAVYYRRALDALAKLADGHDRDMQEIDLQLGLATALQGLRGYGTTEYGEALARATELVDRSNDPAKIYTLLYGRWSAQFVAGHRRSALDLATNYLALARRQTNSEHVVVGLRLMASSLRSVGRAGEALEHGREALALYDPAAHGDLAHVYGSDCKVTLLIQLSIASYDTGLVATANAYMDEAYERATALGHANTIGYCVSFRAPLFAFQNRLDEVAELNRLQAQLAAQHQLGHWGSQIAARDALLCNSRGDYPSAIAKLNHSIAAMEAVNMYSSMPSCLKDLGIAYAGARDHAAAEAAFKRAIEVSEMTGEQWCASDIHAAWGAARADAGRAAAEPVLRKAIDTAGGFGLHLWSIRAALAILDRPVVAPLHSAALAALSDAMAAIPPHEHAGDRPLFDRALAWLPASRVRRADRG